jgi:hypothetical protein
MIRAREGGNERERDGQGDGDMEGQILLRLNKTYPNLMFLTGNGHPPPPLQVLCLLRLESQV